MPYSASTRPNAPKVAVSTASTPTSKYSACIRRMRSGRVSTRCSLQPSSVGAAEVVGSEVLVLDPGAEGAVEDEDALAQRGEEVGHSRPEATQAVMRRPTASLVAPRRTRTRSACSQSYRSPELSP